MSAEVSDAPDDYSLVLAADRDALVGLSVTLVSFLEHNPGKRDVLVLHDGLPKTELASLRAIAAEFGGNPIQLIDMKERIWRFHGVNVPAHLSRAAYFRLEGAEFAETNFVLYLDSDVLVRAKLSVPTGLSRGRFHTSMVRDPSVLFLGQEIGVPDWKKHKLPPDAKFGNTGVMWMNSDYWRSSGTAPEVVRFALTENVPAADQTAINAVLCGDFEELSPKHNLMKQHWEQNFQSAILYTPVQMNAYRSNPSIRHFNGTPKLWRNQSIQPMAPEWYSVLKRIVDTVAPLKSLHSFRKSLQELWSREN